MVLKVKFLEQSQEIPCDFGEVHEIAGAEGYGKGYNDGKKDGYADGYGDGETAGRAEGFEDGKQAGYDEGYQAGTEESAVDLQYFDGILSDTTTTVVNNRITNLREYALANSSVRSVSFENVVTLGERVFNVCADLSDVNFPRAEVIEAYAFFRTISLKILRLPSCLEIGASALSSSGIETLILGSGKVCALLNTSALNSTPIANKKGYIYVPKSLVDSYKTATNWTKYANQFRAIEDYTVDGTLNGEMDWEKMGVAA